MYLECSRNQQSVYKDSLPSCLDSSSSNSFCSTIAFPLSLAWLLTLRFAPHTLNLVGQAIMFGVNRAAYNNVAEQLDTEEAYMQEWRNQGPLGVLTDVINYIKTPQQYELFREFQHAANAALPTSDRLKVLEPVKPVVTRWNSYYAAFRRATQLQAAYNAYAEHHINRITLDDRRASQQNNKLPDAPGWMRSTGLTAADWAIITEHQDCLEPLKLATERLEGRSKAGKFGARQANSVQYMRLYQYSNTYSARSKRVRVNTRM
jgi:hypothetical protein